MVKFSVFDCSILELDKHHSDRKGNLTVIQNGETLPFNVKRVYYLYDVPGGESRGSHAHRNLHKERRTSAAHRGSDTALHFHVPDNREQQYRQALHARCL